jgi:hypothetical protein
MRYFYTITLILISMEVKELLKSKLYKASAVLGLSLLAFNSNAQTAVTVDASKDWVGGMVVYQNTPQQAYEFYSDWGLADVKTEKNTTANTLTLYPNYNTYNATDAYWSNGAMGNKIMQGLSLVIDDALVGQQFTFSGTVVSNTLAAGYEAHAFVKALDATFQPLNEVHVILDEPGNFTINYNAAQFAGAAHIQYGFWVKGLNANPTTMTQNGNMVVTSGAPETNPGGGDSILVTPDASEAWTGAMLVYDNTPEQAYLFYSDWGIADVKTELNTTDNQILLYPNYNVYNPTDAYWANGANGNKIMMGISYVLDDTLLGEDITYTGVVLENTLTDAYEVKAFVKTLDGAYGLINETVVPLDAAGNFTINYNSNNYPGGVHLQYGFSVKGINANPATMAQNGFMRIGQAAAAAPSFALKPVMVYPNPATNVLNISSENAIESLSVYNLLGQQIIETKPGQNTAQVNVSNLTSGIYIVNTTIAGKQTATRFVKQ